MALAALAGETFVSIPHLQRGGLSYRAAELCLGAGFYPRPARALSRKTSQLQLIEAGFGVALVPASMRAIAPPAVSFMSLAEAEAYSEVALAWRRDDSPWWKASSNISWRICRTKPRIDRTSRCAALSCRPCVTIPSNGSASIARC